MVRRTKEEALETRTRILDTAETVFMEKGVSRTSLADIADATGVTRGAIYWHFRNKGDLLNAMFERVALPMEGMVERSADDAPADPIANVRAVCVHMLRHVAENVQCRRVFEIFCFKCEHAEEIAGTVARHLECSAEGVGMFESAFRNALRKGQLPAALNVRRAAIGLHAYMDGLIYNWLLNPVSFPLAKEAEALVDQYLNGLKAAPATERRLVSRHRLKQPAATRTD
jgi:TetR/AcrR family acrAB operon transcriptional repressor